MNNQIYPKIPIEWEEWKIKSVCSRITAGGTPSRKIKEYFLNGEIPWIKSGEVNFSEITKTKEYITEQALKDSAAKIFPPKTVLFALYGATAGKVAYIKKPMSSNQAILGLIPKENMINFLFLFYLLQYKHRKFQSMRIGGAQPNLNASDVKNFRIQIPSLLEQQKIVRILSNVDVIIQQTQQRIDQLQLLKKGLMQRLFAEGIGHTEFKETKLGRIPKEWGIERLSELITLDQSGLDMGKTGQSYNNDINYIKMNNITIDGFLDYEDLVKINIDNELLKKYRLNKGDLLFNVRNSLKLVGKTAVYEGEFQPIIHNNNLVRFGFNEKTTSKYINFYLHSRTGRSQIHRIKSAITSVVATYKKDIMKIKVLLPKLKEQTHIVNILDNIDEKIKNEFSYIKKLKLVKKGLMQQLLIGKKRVPVN